MSSRTRDQGLLGVFEHYDSMLSALKQARAQRIEVRDVYTPVPSHEVEEFLSPQSSPVRVTTISGGLLGLISGMVLAIGTSLIWNLIVGGKPVTSIIPFLVVGFELTILFGALCTLTSLLFFAGLPFKMIPMQVHVAGGVGLIAGAVLTYLLAGRPVNSAELITLMLIGPGVVGIVSGLCAGAALLIHGVPAAFCYPAPAYRPEFTEDRFGVWLDGTDGDEAAGRKVLEEAGAVEILEVDRGGQP